MYAAVRVRGCVNLGEPVKRTLAFLNLNRVNRLVVVPESPASKKMLKKVESYVTWGELNAETLARLLGKRGRLSISKPLSQDWLKENKFGSFKALAEAVEKSSLRKLGLKPFFALKPPSKGYERGGIKKAYSIGGALGYRGREINALAERML